MDKPRLPIVGRRKFITLTGASLLAGASGYFFGSKLQKTADLLTQENNYFQNGIYQEKIHFPIHIIDGPDKMHAFKNFLPSYQQNHKLEIGALFKKANVIIKTDTLVVGAGISGLAAATKLKNKEFIIVEASNEPGGTAAAHTIGRHRMATGAHYTLEYPNSFGPEVAEMLEELNILKYSAASNRWTFVENKFLVPENEMQQVLQNHKYSPEIKISEQDMSSLLNVFSKYYGKLNLPNRLNSADIKQLGTISFHRFLMKHITSLTEQTINSINYRLKDDYSSTIENVSALAGLTHYAGRPLTEEPFKIFSPKEGNSYFAKKMLDRFGENQILLSHPLVSIQRIDNRFESLVFNLKTNELKKIISNNVVYAANKHSLKYTFPSQSELFNSNEYAPWVVVGFSLKADIERQIFWQNEWLGSDENFIGFVDSRAQGDKKDSFFLTAYFCLPPSERFLLNEISKNPAFYAKNALYLVSSYLKKNLNPFIEEAFIRPLGHGMAIPKVNHTSLDKNQVRQFKNFVFAGVDNARLPLIYEAFDSGIIATKELYG